MIECLGPDLKRWVVDHAAEVPDRLTQLSPTGSQRRFEPSTHQFVTHFALQSLPR